MQVFSLISQEGLTELLDDQNISDDALLHIMDAERAQKLAGDLTAASATGELVVLVTERKE